MALIPWIIIISGMILLVVMRLLPLFLLVVEQLLPFLLSVAERLPLLRFIAKRLSETRRLHSEFSDDAKKVGREERSATLGHEDWMPIIVSIAVLASSLFIILSKGYEGDEQKWAFGIVGTILGYWLKT